MCNILSHPYLVSDALLKDERDDISVWVPIILSLAGDIADKLLGAIVSAIGDTYIDVSMVAVVGVSPVVAFGTSLSFDGDARTDGRGTCSCCATTMEGCLAVQVCMPSYHVCSISPSLAIPQLPNQDPPRAQQLSLPDF